MRAWPDLYFPPSLDGIAHPALSLFDSYKKERVSIDESDISMYVCGITPYDATHLGHAATYISYDLVHRYLRASGKSVHFVENITDIDDPLLERARVCQVPIASCCSTKDSTFPSKDGFSISLFFC
jgi:L-cysteine:1D-myo-inositol 2-amino-2-deoxy-alpha-D-glucopyranoside ligase